MVDKLKIKDIENLDQEDPDGEEEDLVEVKTPAPDDDGEKEAIPADKPEDGPDDLDESDDESDDLDDENLEAKREARRQERRERKERRRLAEERNRRIIAELQDKIRFLEGYSARTASAIQRDKIEERVRVLRATYQGSREALEEINQRISEATRNNDGDALVRAIEDRDAALRTMGAAQAEYNDIVRIVQEANNRRVNNTGNGEKISPKALTNFQAWNKAHPWFDYRGGDQDSKLVQAVDQQVADDGYDPDTPDYWEELTRRIRKVLPHRFKADNGKRRGPPVQGSGSESKYDSARRFNASVLSKERIEAIKEAGMWDDPEKRKRMIAQYEKFDNAQARNR